jgi:hypothetical protein
MENSPPVPDPTILTTEALGRAMSSMRDYVDGQLGIRDERFRGIDTATRVLNETVNRVPTDMQQEIGHIREVMDEKFSSVGMRFVERDTRSERESRDNKVAVDAAFAAQKEAASEQNKSNTLAISKSEMATAETLNKLAELVATQLSALSEKVDDLKERVTRAESNAEGHSQHQDQRESAATARGQIMSGYAGMISVAVSVGVAVFVAVHG